jgi:hypothetical protein
MMVGEKGTYRLYPLVDGGLLQESLLSLDLSEVGLP